ncbi:hypothetical protein [Massilia sp. METH4]|uniref:hypothetical protein n=1 Tax=Massilia sp. METH4 TaxID=3123041 RepID=UPI0030D0FAEE
MKRTIRRYLAVLPMVAAGLGAARGQAMGNPGGEVGMLLVLDAPASQGQVKLRVELENRGKRTVLVPRAVASMERLLGNVFTVTDAVTGEAVTYVGPMVKRGPLTAADYLALKPGQRHRHVIDIGPAYDFKPGRHDYRVSYAGHYVADARALAGTGAPGMPLEAPPVTFSVAR